MSAMYSIDIQCDKCGRWLPGESRPGVTIRQIREKVRPFGWTTYREKGRHKDLCPKCSQESSHAQ